jgi:hypothetical protein
MQTLMIKDLPMSEELDSKGMTAVRGGKSSGWYYPDVFDSFNTTDSFNKTDNKIMQKQENFLSIGDVAGFGKGSAVKVDFHPNQTADIHNRVG